MSPRQQRGNERCPHGNVRRAPTRSFCLLVSRVPVLAVFEHAGDVHNARSNVNEVKADLALVGQGSGLQLLVVLGAHVAHLLSSCSSVSVSCSLVVSDQVQRGPASQTRTMSLASGRKDGEGEVFHNYQAT